MEKLENFGEYAGYLRQLQKEAKSEKIFSSDFHLFGNVERYLQLCVQIIIDIVHLTIIDLGLKRPADNYEAISVLCEKKIISAVLASKLVKMVGLRNILVHEYGKIDRKKIYKILKENVKDLEMFKKQIVGHIK